MPPEVKNWVELLQNPVGTRWAPEAEREKKTEAARKLGSTKDKVLEAASLLEAKGRVEVKRHFAGSEIRAAPSLVLESWERAAKRSSEELIDLMEAEKKLSLVEAAKKLLVPEGKVAEWANEAKDRELVERAGDLLIARTVQIRKYRITRRIDEEAKVGVYVYTPLDMLLELVRADGELKVSEAAKAVDKKPEGIEAWVKTLKGLFTIEYPINVLEDAIIKAAPKKEPVLEAQPVGKILEAYSITADKVPAKVKVISTKSDSMPLYLVELPKIGEATLALMNALTDRLSEKVTIDAEEITDPKRMNQLKEKFFSEAKRIIQQEVSISDWRADIIAGIILHRMYGLGEIELLMYDDWLEEVCVNTSHVPLTAYHKKYGWVETNLRLDDERAVYNYAAQIGRKVERNITSMEPIMDAHLLSGDRVNATLFPVSSFGNTITIRKFARQPWTIVHFISPEMETLGRDMAAFLWLCFQYELNVIVGGGTASGKTSMLNSLCALIQPTHRVITIEDTRELTLPKYLYWNWVPLTTRAANPEGKGEVSMLDLIVTSLRMRPDRIVLGEIRRRREAEVLFEAMHTGHSVYSTVHADTAQNLKRRLMEPPIELPSAEIEALHLIIVVYRDRRKGIRKVFEVAEIVPGTAGKEFELNYLYRWNPRSKKFLKVNESRRIMDELELHTGMSREEIEGDIKEKEMILDWMLRNRIMSLDDVGAVMDEYYRSRETLLDKVKVGTVKNGNTADDSAP